MDPSTCNLNVCQGEIGAEIGAEIVESVTQVSLGIGNDTFTDVENSPLFIKSNPLPLDILELSQEETACKYCGISYLLLTKYEKMSNQLRELRLEIDKNKDIVLERPGLLSKIESLSKLQYESNQKIEELEEKVESSSLKNYNDSEKIIKLEKERFKLIEMVQKSLKYKEKTKDSAGFLKNEISQSRDSTNCLRKEVLKNLDIFKDYKSAVKQFQENLLEKFGKSLNLYKIEIRDLKSTIQDLEKEISSNLITKNELQDQLLKENATAKLEFDKFNSEKMKLNSRIMDLEKHVKDLDYKYQEKEEEIKGFKEEIDGKNQKLENQDKNLGGKDTFIKKLEKEIQDYKKKSDAVQSLATQAGMGLAKKDEMIYELESNLKSLKQELKALQLEREKTIEAHQSRIKQLQDNFLEKLKDAGKEQVEKENDKIKRIMLAEKEAAIKEWTIQLQEEFDEKERSLKDQTLVIKKKYDDLKKQLVHKEVDWKKKCDILVEQNKKAQDSNAADFEHYQSRIRSLEAEIIKNQAAPAADGPSPSLEEISALKNIIEKRNAEIVFLKDTVRLECEERIGLIAKLAILTKNGTIPIQEPASISNNIPSQALQEPIIQNIASSESKNCSASSGRKNFEAMMYEAAMKKEKKLAKSSSRKKLYGT